MRGGSELPLHVFHSQCRRNQPFACHAFVTPGNTFVTPLVTLLSRLKFALPCCAVLCLSSTPFFMSWSLMFKKNKSSISYLLIVFVFALLILGVYLFFRFRMSTAERKSEYRVMNENCTTPLTSYKSKWKL